MSNRTAVIHPQGSCEPASLALPRLNEIVVRLGNVIGGGRHASVPLGDRTIHVRATLQAAEPDAQGEPPVTMYTEFGICNLVPAGAIVRLLTGMALPTWQDCPDIEFRQWALDKAFERMPPQWQALFGANGLAEGMRAPDEAGVTLYLEVPGQGQTLVARVSGMPHVLGNIFSSDKWQDEAPAPARRLNALPVRRRVTIARSRIPARQFRRLAPDDLLLIDEPLFDEDGAGTIRIGRAEMHGRLLMDGPRLQFEFDEWRVGMDDADYDDHEDYESHDGDEDQDDQSDEEASGEEHEDEHDGDDSDGDSDGDSEEGADEDGGSDAGEDRDDAIDLDAEGGDPALDDLPMRLSFEAGAVDVRFSELRRLASGSVIDLGQPVPPTITIRCNGVDIGRGELVEVEGRLAVRATEIWGRHEH